MVAVVIPPGSGFVDGEPVARNLPIALPVSRATLRRTIWKNSIGPDSRAIDQTILELRRKLESTPARPRYILKSSKLGYRLDGRWVAEKAA